MSPDMLAGGSQGAPSPGGPGGAPGGAAMPPGLPPANPLLMLQKLMRSKRGGKGKRRGGKKRSK